MSQTQTDDTVSRLFTAGVPGALTPASLAASRERSHESNRRREHEHRRSVARARRTEAELRALADQGRELLHGSGIGAGDEADTDAVLAWVVETFGDRVAVASSMADTVLPHVISTYKPWVDVLFLDTGYHFPETIQTRDRAAREMQVSVVSITPEESVAQQDASRGPELFRRDPTECCRLRKVVPLRDRLAEYEVWISGVRRADAPSRAQAPLVAWDQANKLVKVNPLAAWTDERVDNYIDEHNVIRNPLLTQGYPSIGCAPCTSEVAPGEDPRSGRWVGQTKTECGLHVI